jgi:hypothetical protein
MSLKSMQRHLRKIAVRKTSLSVSLMSQNTQYSLPSIERTHDWRPRVVLEQVTSLYSSKRNNAICYTIPSCSPDCSFVSLNVYAFILCTSHFILLRKQGENINWNRYYFMNPFLGWPQTDVTISLSKFFLQTHTYKYIRLLLSIKEVTSADE